MNTGTTIVVPFASGWVPVASQTITISGATPHNVLLDGVFSAVNGSTVGATFQIDGASSFGDPFWGLGIQCIGACGGGHHRLPISRVQQVSPGQHSISLMARNDAGTANVLLVSLSVVDLGPAQ
jgi:hypothetical protein